MHSTGFSSGRIFRIVFFRSDPTSAAELSLWAKANQASAMIDLGRGPATTITPTVPSAHSAHIQVGTNGGARS